MFLVVTLAAIYLASNVASAATVPQYEKVYYDLDDADNLYKEYLEIHNKHYSVEEYGKRLEIFKESLKEINIKNEIFSQTVFGPTVFSDLTPEERKSHGGLLPFNSTEGISLEVEPDVVYEDHFDWRDKGVVTPVKNQGPCGSCYIFSAIGNIEGQYAINHKECLSLSEQEALDCLHNRGCGGGCPHEVMSQLARDKSALELEKDYPYSAAKGRCVEKASQKRVTVKGGDRVDTKDEETLKQYLVKYGPLSIGVDDTDMMAYSKGVLHPTKCGKKLNHAMLLVGYGEEAGTPYWIIKNSWGQRYGEEGYVRLVRGIKACGISTYVATSTVA